MTTRPPGFDEGDPDAATNGIYGVNGHPDENVQPPWLPATRPASQPPGAGPAGHDERARHVPLGELDEPRRGRPPGTGPSSAPASQPLPPNARVSHKGRPKQPRSARPLPPPLDDVDGYDLRPNPLGAKTVPDLMECVRQYYIWAGKRGLRVMARHIDQQLSAQTLSNLLKSDHLPGRLDQMRLLIEACGGNAEDQQRFVTAWRRFTMG